MSGVASNQVVDNRNRNQSVSDFTKTIFNLLKFLETKDNSGSTSRVINLMKVAKRVDHEVVITNVGPYLHKYQKMLDARNEDLFTMNMMLEEMDQTESGQIESYRKLALTMFDIIHAEKAKLDAPTFNWIWESLEYLLDTYYHYCTRCIKEEKS